MTQKARAERFPVWMSPEMREAVMRAAVEDTVVMRHPVSSAEWVREAIRQRLEAEHPDLAEHPLTDDGGEA